VFCQISECCSVQPTYEMCFVKYLSAAQYSLHTRRVLSNLWVLLSTAYIRDVFCQISWVLFSTAYIRDVFCQIPECCSVQSTYETCFLVSVLVLLIRSRGFWHAVRNTATRKSIVLLGFVVDTASHPAIKHEMFVCTVNTFSLNSMKQSVSWKDNSLSASEKNPTYYEIRKFIAMFTKSRYWPLSRGKLIQSSSFSWKIYFNIISSTPGNSEWWLPLTRVLLATSTLSSLTLWLKSTVRSDVISIGTTVNVSISQKVWVRMSTKERHLANKLNLYLVSVIIGYLNWNNWHWKRLPYEIFTQHLSETLRKPFKHNIINSLKK
jgi:hypothetical protein